MPESRVHDVLQGIGLLLSDVSGRPEVGRDHSHRIGFLAPRPNWFQEFVLGHPKPYRPSAPLGMILHVLFLACKPVPRSWCVVMAVSQGRIADLVIGCHSETR